MRILLIGKDGQVGWELCRSLEGIGCELMAVGRQELDLTNADALRSTIRSFSPKLIVNAAAYTAVDRAEEEKTLAFKVNADAPAILAEEAQEARAGLIHYSTDYVFDGTRRAPYSEDDPTNPVNVYGASKLAGEQAIANSGAPYFIFRTSWVYGPRGRNFLLTMLRLAAERSEIKVVNDQIGAPTSSRSIAEATADIITDCFPAESSAAKNGLVTMQALRGIYNMTARGSTSWHGFASAILDRITPNVSVLPIPSTEYKTPAQRPAYSVLSGDKLRSTFDVVMPRWEQSLEQVIGDGEFRLSAAAASAGSASR